MMEWVVGALEKTVPWVLDCWKAGQRGKRRRLHIYVLKAMGRADGIVAPDLDGVRFDLASIDRKLLIAQRHEALGGDEAIDDFILFAEEPETKQYRAALKKQEKKGLPGVHDADRRQKLENILHDMVEAGKLRFHPPSMWSVL